MKQIKLFTLCAISLLFISCMNPIQKQACKTVETLINAGATKDLETMKVVAPFVNDYPEEQQQAFADYIFSLSEEKKSIKADKIEDGIIFVDLTLFDFETGGENVLVLECVTDENNNVTITENITYKSVIQYIDYISLEELQ